MSASATEAEILIGDFQWRFPMEIPDRDSPLLRSTEVYQENASKYPLHSLQALKVSITKRKLEKDQQFLSQFEE